MTQGGAHIAASTKLPWKHPSEIIERTEGATGVWSAMGE